jgi:hypothetical protein
MDPTVILNRLVRLAKLDTSVFDEAQELIPGVIVAVVSAFLAGLGVFLWWSMQDFTPDGNFINNFILGSIFLAALYGVAALVIYVVLAQMYHVQVELPALVRTMGYAAAPLAASVLMFIPIIWPVFSLVPLALLFVLMIYAVQSVSGAESRQVIMATTIGFTVMVLILGFLALASSETDVPMGAGQFGLILDFS